MVFLVGLGGIGMVGSPLQARVGMKTTNGSLRQLKTGDLNQGPTPLPARRIADVGPTQDAQVARCLGRLATAPQRGTRQTLLLLGVATAVMGQ